MVSEYYGAIWRAKSHVREVAQIVANAPNFRHAVAEATIRIRARLPPDLQSYIKPNDVAQWLQNSALIDEEAYIKLQNLKTREDTEV